MIEIGRCLLLGCCYFGWDNFFEPIAWLDWNHSISIHKTMQSVSIFWGFTLFKDDRRYCKCQQVSWVSILSELEDIFSHWSLCPKELWLCFCLLFGSFLRCFCRMASFRLALDWKWLSCILLLMLSLLNCTHFLGFIFFFLRSIFPKGFG